MRDPVRPAMNEFEYLLSEKISWAILVFNEPQVLKNASSPSEFRDEMSGIASRLATFIKPFI